MPVRGLSFGAVLLCSMLVMGADQIASPIPTASEQRIYLSGGEVKALNVAYNTFLASKETGGSTVPLDDLLVSVRHLTDGYHIDFQAYPNAGTSWTYQYIVNATNFQIHLASEGTEVFHN